MPEISKSTCLTDSELVENIPNLLCIKDGKGRWLHAKPNYLKLFNLQGTSYINETDSTLRKRLKVNTNALKLSATLDQRAWVTRSSVKSVRSKPSSREVDDTFELTRTPVFDQDGQPSRLFISGRAPYQGEQQTESKLELLSSVIHCRHLNILLFDHNFNITESNEAFFLLTDLSSSEIINKPLSFVFNHGDSDSFKQSLKPYSKQYNNGYWSLRLTCRRQNSDNFPVKVVVSPVRFGAGEITHYCATVYDITRQKLKEERIIQMSHYDALTGLGNRRMFFENLSKFISAATRHKLYAIIFFVDLDRFKLVNDSLGHDAGDLLLKEVAKRLTYIVRKHDVVSRFSGDEFALLILNKKSQEKAIYESSLIAKKIIQELSKMFYIHRKQVFIGASVGISIFPENGLNAEILMKNADLAMYDAKNQGRNNYKFYKKEYTTAINNKQIIENDLRLALERNELQLYYQPQYTADRHQLWGAEVLIRWIRDPHGKKTIIPPNVFIPVAEETGLIIEIGQWILKTACQQLQIWVEKGYPLKQVSVNVSGRQFMDSDFLKSLDVALRHSGLDPTKLELEIIESMLMGDTKQIQLKLDRIKKLGIKLALDDFGTGYSSLAYLNNFPIDILKIDQSFVMDMTTDSKKARIVCAIIEMGHSLKQKVVAEGVENKHQLSFLKARGCDIIQGYYFNKPMSMQKMDSLLREESISKVAP